MQYVDSSLSTKGRLVSDQLRFRDGIPVFSIVEFNIWGSCNRRCPFCPVSNPEIYTERREGIELDNYKKILTDLESISFDGMILWSMFSEPLLHKNILDLATATKTALPSVRLQIVSNGDIVRKHSHKLMELFSSGVDHVQISLYDNDSQYQEFIDIQNHLNLSEEQITLRRRYHKDGNFNLTISNRAGLVDSNLYRSETETNIDFNTLPLARRCHYPFYQMAIDYNGDVLLCAHDWSKDLVLGNAFTEHIWNIWTGERIQEVRSSLKNANRNYDPCRKCDVDGQLIGFEHFAAFTARPDPVGN